MIRLNEAIYYAVREDFNNHTTPGHIDVEHDDIIREAIAYVEAHPEALEGLAAVEVSALAHAAARRG